MIFKNRRRRASRTPEYKAFRNARQRCEYERDRKYIYYGGRGIRFLFKTFLQFWEELGPKPSPKHLYSLDRIDSDGNYEPGNVKWSTRQEQNRNRQYRGLGRTMQLAA